MAPSAELTLFQIWQLLNERIAVDAHSGAQIMIDTVHARVHEGMFFSASYKTPDGSPLADDATLVFLVKVGATNDAHIVWDAASGGEGQIQFFEGPDVSADGTPLLEANMNRGSSGVAEVTTFHTPTIGGGGNGTELLDMLLPGGTHPRAQGSVARPGTEWVLAKSTNYLLIITNRAGSAQQVSAHLQWYEHA